VSCDSANNEQRAAQLAVCMTEREREREGQEDRVIRDGIEATMVQVASWFV